MVIRQNGHSAKWSFGKMVSRRNGHSAKWLVGEMVSRRNGQSAKWSDGEMVFDETSRIRENRSSGFPTRSDTNRAVQLHKMAGGLKFRI